MTYQIKNEHDNNHYKDMLLAVLPLIVCGLILYGPRVLLMCATAMLTARAVDVGVSMLRGKDFDSQDHSSTLSALVFCMLLPVNIPLYIIITTVIITTLVGKHLFGGAGVYPFNLTALSMCLAAVNWPEKVFSAVTPFSKVAFWSGEAASVVASNAGIIKDGGVPYISTFNMFLGNYPGVIGADFILVIISVAIFLYATKRITWHIPVSFFLTCTAFAFLFPRVYGFSRVSSLELEMLNGAIIFFAVYMMNEPATTPKNPKAKIIFGILTGILTMIFRYFGSYEIGTCFALLLVNTIEGFIDRAVMWRPVVEVKKPVYKQDGDIADKPVKKKKEKTKGFGDAIDLIGETEDNIDQVLYSTRTIDITAVLAEEERMLARKRKENKKNDKSK